jgi:uncharacterized protein (TIGR02466 family)
MIINEKLESIFSIEVLSFNLDLDHEAISAHCEKMVSLTNEKRFERNRTRTTFHDRDANTRLAEEFPERELFEKLIVHCGNKFLKKTGREKLLERGSPRLSYWASVYGENDQHSTHIHNGANLSGTYYPQSAGKQMVPIVFENPMLTTFVADPVPAEKSYFTVLPHTGQCLIWPSWLPHHVPMVPKPEGKKRIAISFNILYK